MVPPCYLLLRMVKSVRYLLSFELILKLQLGTSFLERIFSALLLGPEIVDLQRIYFCIDGEFFLFLFILVNIFIINIHDKYIISYLHLEAI